jgi:hypothetical protein
MIRSSLDLVAIANDRRTSSDVQDQLRDSPRNQKMTHASMLVQCHQHIGTGLDIGEVQAEQQRCQNTSLRLSIIESTPSTAFITKKDLEETN